MATSTEMQPTPKYATNHAHNCQGDCKWGNGRVLVPILQVLRLNVFFAASIGE